MMVCGEEGGIQGTEGRRFSFCSLFALAQARPVCTGQEAWWAQAPPSENWHLCALPREWRRQTLHSSLSSPCPLVTSQGNQSRLMQRQIWQPLVWCDLCRGKGFLAGMATFQLAFFPSKQELSKNPYLKCKWPRERNRHSSVINRPQWELVSSEFSKLNNQDLKSGTRT